MCQDVRPFQENTTLTESFRRLPHKLHLTPETMRLLTLQLLHLLCCAVLNLHLKLPRVFMVHVAVIVEQVPIQCSSTRSLAILDFARLGGIIAVTRIIVGMSLPRAQTHPAEVMFTLPACHVVATAILFNSRVALWAVLRVHGEPVEGFAIVCTLLKPSLHRLAVGRRVHLLAAFNAEAMSLLAGDELRARVSYVHAQTAPGLRTPNSGFTVIHE
mmetsp:Transcript_10394/g.12173  ORF Transcript_10394/g.12173 Transcript_10394/m.12173 type:complete len:215 (+) Transcript_10394:756-1400(+)